MFGTRFAYFSGDMTDVQILFGDIIAEEPGKGNFVVRKDGKLVSPFEYAYFWWLTPKACALRRDGSQKVDILFSNGRWFFGAIYAHELLKRGPNVDEYLIAAVVQHGTHVLNEEGDYLAFIPGYPRITFLYDSLLVAFHQEGPTPRVRVYDLHGRFLSEGELWDAISEAMEKV
jgi:hypothetical protein